MRWPLRNKIVTRVVLLLFGTIAVLTVANLMTISSTHQRLFEDRIRRIFQLVTESRFPLTSNVLDDMSQLTGAEFAVVGGSGQVTSRSSGAPLPDAWAELPSSDLGQVEFDSPLWWDEQPFIHKVMPLGPRANRDSTGTETSVHVFIDPDPYQQVSRRSIQSVLLVAGIVTPAALLIGLALASYVTRPLRRLQEQVQRIAAGELIHVPVSSGNDEITDLQKSVNEMVERLQDHEHQLRRNERLGALIQLGSGIAHHLKNCVTGCQMAIELLGTKEATVRQSENTQVALRQLSLMTKYINRFLALGRSERHGDPAVTSRVDLADTLNSVLFLVGPTVKHLNVELIHESEGGPVVVSMARDDAEQMMLNLINNAIEATSRTGDGPSSSRRVSVRLSQTDQEVVFSVADNGAGPPPELADSILNPFVTSKQEGAGLGLALVQQIVERAGGSLTWKRVDGETCFEVKLNVD